MPSLTGSGFIIRADGLVLTNNHVIEESTSIDVRLYDGETTTATVLGRDSLGDVALLQLATKRPCRSYLSAVRRLHTLVSWWWRLAVPSVSSIRLPWVL